MTDSPRRRLTSVYDLENQVGTVESRLKFPGTCPVYCHKTARFPFKNRHRSKNDIGSHQRRSRTCNYIVAIYSQMTTSAVNRTTAILFLPPWQSRNEVS